MEQNFLLEVEFQPEMQKSSRRFLSCAKDKRTSSLLMLRALHFRRFLGRFEPNYAIVLKGYSLLNKAYHVSILCIHNL